MIIRRKALLIDGKAIARLRLEILRNKIQGTKIRPKLAVVLVGNDPASVMYVNLKRKRAEEVGIKVELVKIQDTGYKIQEKLEEKIQELNQDRSVHGVMVQLPLPSEINADEVLAKIDPTKDVDGLTGKGKFLPATVRAIFTALDEVLGSSGQVLGKNVTIIGRSREVGKPLAEEMRRRRAIVSVAHSQTEDLEKLTRGADILVSATGRPGLVKAGMVKPGAVVIDVGSPKGDVDPAVAEIAAAITPVPGGIGPLTVVSLLENLVEAAKIQLSNMASV